LYFLYRAKLDEPEYAPFVKLNLSLVSNKNDLTEQAKSHNNGRITQEHKL